MELNNSTVKVSAQVKTFQSLSRHKNTNDVRGARRGVAGVGGVGLTCSSVNIQADEVQRTLVRRPAGFTVLDVSSARTVPEGVAVSSQVHLDTHGRQRDAQLLTPPSSEGAPYL